MGGAKGRQQAIAPIFYLAGGILRHFIAHFAASREFLRKCLRFGPNSARASV
ncbi:hypothetical protein RKLH11_1126 [Rhodobacteraceae bacterium KLH11]|nr:hypothetical protein RKLH11_1126 [Rhodobacteraceae bacterium KLH11]